MLISSLSVHRSKNRLRGLGNPRCTKCLDANGLRVFQLTRPSHSSSSGLARGLNPQAPDPAKCPDHERLAEEASGTKRTIGPASSQSRHHLPAACFIPVNSLTR